MALKSPVMNFQKRRGGVVGLSLGGLLRAAVISLLIGAGTSEQCSAVQRSVLGAGSWW